MCSSYNNKTKWITCLSQGGLFHPSPEFFDACKIFELHFNDFHGKELSRVYDPIVSFANILVDHYPMWDKEILMLYSKTRFFIRLKHLNKQIKAKETSEKSRSLKQMANHL